jgi:aspartate racemase
MTRIGLIGGLSWESTAVYYRLLNQSTAQRLGAWQQPQVLIDSLNFADIVHLQSRGEWAAMGEMMAHSARRLELGGADVVGICSNTMHASYDEVRRAVSIPVVDVRDAVAARVRTLDHQSISLLGTKYLVESDFYSSALEREGIRVIKPSSEQTDELQRIIYDELTQGVVNEASREWLIEVAGECRSRGGDVVGLCCTELGLLVDESNAPWPFVDSTVAHVQSLLNS